MDKAVAYINKISAIYNLDAKTKASLLEITDKINKTFENWAWEDINYAIDFYYTKKSDRNYPKSVHILAILNTNTHNKASNLPADKRKDDWWHNPPSTNIKLITDAFEKVCRYAHKIGVLNIPFYSMVEGIKNGSDSYIRYLDEEKTQPRIWYIRWDWDDAVLEAKRRFPDTFGKFNNLTKPELYTFAYKLGLINIGE